LSASLGTVNLESSIPYFCLKELYQGGLEIVRAGEWRRPREHALAVSHVDVEPAHRHSGMDAIP
jgi:hypothetical protein